MQIVFYGISTIVSGLLNASRDYLWSSAAPIFNNIIVTVTFVAYAFVAPSNPELAKFIIAIGNPLGVLATSVSKGIVSGLDREVTIDGQQMTLMQVNASVNPGNSGGGLFNADGELVGIVNSKASGENVEGIGFAIPMDTAKSVITDLMDHGFVTGRP